MKFMRKPVAAAVLAILAGVAPLASAQTEADQSPAQSATNKQKEKIQTLETVQVAASRIYRPDLALPTPQVPISPQIINLNDAATNLGAAVADLPYFSPSTNPTNGATNGGLGMSPMDLRGLGSTRTLVLLDGHRMIGNGNPATIPSALIKTVQVVTGGASASWGSGAVAGVVNIVTNDDLEGTTLGAGIGLSSAKDAHEKQFNIATGKSFDGGKAHITFGFNYLNRDEVWPRFSKRDGNGLSAALPTASGLWQFFPDVGTTDMADGGLILGGPFNGYAFNPDGSLRLANLGTPSYPGSYFTSGGESRYITDYATLEAPLQYYSSLTDFHYDFSDNLRFKAQVSAARTWNNFPFFAEPAGGVINVDNPFLSPSVRQAMVSAGVDSFYLNRVNQDIAMQTTNFSQKDTQITAGLEGLWGTWRWNAYLSQGWQNLYVAQPHNLLTNEWNNALDAVADPVTGQPVCAITLTDPSSSCVPLNPFGMGAASQAAIDYVTGTVVAQTASKLSVAAANIQGEPFSLPAGDVSVAAGLEWRREGSNTTVPSYPDPADFMYGAGVPLGGAFTVSEAYGDVLAPLVADKPLLHNLAAEAAARVSRYSQSGTIWSWKLGLTNEFFGGLTGRIGLSKDIRAPNIGELFSPQSTGQTPIIDPATGNLETVFFLSGGNPHLRPETSRTFTAGLSWAPERTGFSVSADYFDIDIKGIILPILPQDVVNLCESNGVLCDRITRNPDGSIKYIASDEANLNEYKERGTDFDISYQHPVSALGISGNLHLRALATRVYELSTYDGYSTQQYVGNIGNRLSLGVPAWRGMGSAQFDTGRFSVNARLRWVGAGLLYPPITMVDHQNQIPNYFYWDAGASYTFGDRNPVTVSLNIQNLANKQAPLGTVFLFSPFYDPMGRYFTLTAQMKL